MNQKPATTDAALVRAARELFAAHGYDGTSVRAITARAGANLGAITYHFGSKQALHDAVIASVMGPGRERIVEAAAGPDTPLDRLEVVVRAFFSYLDENPDAIPLMMGVMLSSRPLPDVVARTIAANVHTVSSLIGEGQRDGSVRSGDPRCAQHRRPAALAGAGPARLAGGGGDRPDRSRDTRSAGGECPQLRARWSRSTSGEIRMRRPALRSVVRAAAHAGLILSGVATSAAPQETAERDSLTLAQAVALAQETYPSVAAARAGEDAAVASLGQARAAWWPQLSTQATAVRYEEPMLVAPIHGFSPQQFERIELEKTLFQGNVSLGWTILDGGARVNRIRGARAGAAGAVAGRTAAEMALTARVAGAYLQVLSARGVLDAQERRIEALSAERRRVEQLLGEGRAARVQLLRVDAALAEAEALRVATLTRLDLAERELARLLGVSPAEARVDNLRPVRLALGSELDERPDLVERAKADNPELERARRALETAEANRRVAKAAWIPSLNLTGGLLGFSSEAGNTTTEWNVGIALAYPLFTGGARANAVSRASAEARAAREESRLAELRTEEAVDRALNAALETQALVDALTRAVRYQTEVVRIEQLSLEAGAGTQTDYLRAEADVARARALLVEARHAEIAARVELARVVGELTPGWLAQNLENP